MRLSGFSARIAVRAPIYLVAALLAGGSLLAASGPPQGFHLPLAFEQNQGQFAPQVKWMGRSSGYEVLFDDESARIIIPDKTDQRAGARRLPGTLPPLHLKYDVIQMKLAGSRPWKDISGIEPTGGVSNYLNNKDLKRSLNHIPRYGQVKVANVYKGIDLIFYANGGDLEYDFAVAPGADPQQIQVIFEGTKELLVDSKSGDLIVKLPGGSELRQLKPQVYQQAGKKHIEIAGGYKLLGHERATFTVDSYDRNQALVIDPRLTIARSIGGDKDDQANAIAVDDSGNSFITGFTYSLNFPITNNSQFQQPTDCGNSFPLNPTGCGSAITSNAFVAEVSSDGSIPFVTYYGVGIGNGIAVDSSGIYVSGIAIRPKGDIAVGFEFNNTNGDLYVGKLSRTGEGSYFSTFGGEGTDFGSAIALDDLHNAWAAGATYPDPAGGVTPPPDVLIVKVAPDGTKLFEGKFGSSGEDVALGVAVAARQPWITGKTCGDGFPTTDGLLHQLNHCAAFVLQLDETGHQNMGLLFGGADGDDAGVAIVTNGSDDAFVTGYVNSSNFPTTPGVYTSQPKAEFPGAQAFITEVSPVFSPSSGVGKIIRSTLFLASGGTVIPYAIANDNRGGIYIAGSTSSPFFPLLPVRPLRDPTIGFVSKFRADLSELHYSVSLGNALTGVALRGPLPVFAPEASCGQCSPEIYVAGWQDGTFNDPGSPRDAFMVKMVDDTPTSFVTNTTTQVNTNPFTVSWGGSSPSSSVASFDVFVSDNGGQFTPFLTATTATSAPFTGVPGHSYGFFSIATDASGAKEPMKTGADVTIKIVDVTPPVIAPQITGTLGNNGWYRSDVTVNWSVTDPESGITSWTGCAPANLTADTAGLTLTCSATNGVGLPTSVPITIKLDKMPPVISGMPALPCSLPPPNHPVLQVDNVGAADAVSGLVPNSFSVKVTKNDPSSNVFPPQISIIANGPGEFTVLNANRLASGTGPMFSLTATAMDTAGNSVIAAATCAASHTTAAR